MAPVILAIPSVMVSGTERRLAFVYRHLEARYPGAYRLAVSAEAYAVLNRGGFGLDRLPGVHVFRGRSVLDIKTGAHAPALVNLGRMVSLFRYRRQLQHLIERERAALLQPYLELVPFLGLFPIRGVPWIVPVVDHLPKYFDRHSRDCRLLLRAIRTPVRVDCLYRWIALRLEELGAEPAKLYNPAWNCVNHDAFHPEAKDERLVTFVARAIDWKNPLMMVDVIARVLHRRPDTRFAVLGTGTMASRLQRVIAARGLQAQVRSGYLEDPSPIVNRSLIHVSLDRFDNFPNQSLMEGMAAGCAIVASRVGETYRVVTEDVGRLAPLDAEPIGEAILRLLDDPQKARRLGQAGRERVLANHHVDRYIEYLRLLHDLSQTGRVVDGNLVRVDG
jgi:glycosyltransferase involved in cell wall biosynthesis